MKLYIFFCVYRPFVFLLLIIVCLFRWSIYWLGCVISCFVFEVFACSKWKYFVICIAIKDFLPVYGLLLRSINHLLCYFSNVWISWGPPCQLFPYFLNDWVLFRKNITILRLEGFSSWLSFSTSFRGSGLTLRSFMHLGLGFVQVKR